MDRVLIFGCSGSGKSTLARRIGAVTGLEVIHLDYHYWRAGWQEPSKAEWTGQIREMLVKDRWVMDGQYGGTLLDERIELADTIIYLDRPRWVCLWRVLKRFWMYRNQSRPDMAEGCPERLSREFLRYVWNYAKKRRPEYLKKLRSISSSKRVIILRSDQEMARFIHALQMPVQLT